TITFAALSLPVFAAMSSTRGGWAVGCPALISPGTRTRVILLALIILSALSAQAAWAAAVCRFTTETITIDGVASEAAWKRAQQVGFIVPVTHTKPRRSAVGGLLWDKKNLYVFIRANDRDLRGSVTEDDTAVYVDDCLEVFLRPDPESDRYCNFEFSLAGAIFDEFHGDQRFRGASWDCAGLQRAITRHGTVN